MPEPTSPTRQHKITLGEMRASSVRGLLVYCYKCAHAVRISADRWPDHVRLSDLEPLFVCQACGRKGADIRPDWDDGYRLIVVRDVARVRLFSRNGYDWADRYPLIVEAALKNRTTSFVIDGEALLLGVDGISDFNGLHSRRHDDEVQLYAFDILALEGDDLRSLPLHLRKVKLARLLARRPEGIFVSDFEQGEIGPDLFLHACKFGLEGLVSKRRDRPYRAGRSPDWIKVKNRSHPSLDRVKEAFS
jgi:bifunctional non-homologous end joining protein LigD